MKLSNKLKITLLIAFFIIVLYNLKVFAVTGVITEITVNMRKEPSTSSKKLMYVTQDYKVEVLEKVGEWYKIKYKGVTGYVYGKYLDVDDSKLEIKEESVKEPEIETETIIPDNNNDEQKEDNNDIQDVTTNVPAELQIKEKSEVRLIPNITSNVIYTAKKEVSIDVIEQLGNWSYVYVDNIYGWVRTDNIIEKNSIKPNTDNENDIQDEEVTITERTVAYIKYDTVNLRKKASTSSTVLAKLKLNNEVIIIEETSSKWTKVEYDGITGYVSADLLSSEKVKEKEESNSTSRDGETVSRDEEVENEKEDNQVKEEVEVKPENNNKEPIKEENTTNENKKEEVIETPKEEVKEESSETISKTKGEEIVTYAKKFLGYDYVLGAASPKKGFDCSGLTYYVYKQFGYTLSRTSKLQAKNGVEVSKDELQPGDLLIFKNQALTAIGHVGIYIGNNKMIHASEPGVGVVITDLDARGYNYNKRFVTARRIV